MTRSYSLKPGRTALCAFALLGGTACVAQVVKNPPPVNGPNTNLAPESALAVKRVRIYESGVAQFERSGQLHGVAAALKLREADVDDVLRTLVVRRGTSEVPAYTASFELLTLPRVARVLANLPAEAELGAEYANFVRSLKGERIELSFRGATLHGRLVDVKPIEQTNNDERAEERVSKSGEGKHGPSSTGGSDDWLRAEMPQFELTLLTDHGAVERIHSGKVARLRPLDPTVAARLDRAVSAMSSRRHERTRVLRITSDSAETINLTYVTEAPIARITYRLHTDPNAPATKLQGFALVHNTTDELWGSVAIELSNDDIDSKIVPFVAPRFWDRPLHGTSESQANALPQLNQATADTLHESGEVERNVATSGNPNLNERTYADATGPSRPTSHLRKPRRGNTVYAYAVSTRPTIAPHSSALLAFLETPVKVERGVWFIRKSIAGRSVVRIQNTTAQPLPAGMVSVFDQDHFLGEAEMTQLEPGRWGYFDYANELPITRTSKDDSEPKTAYRKIAWANDTLETSVFEHLEQALTLTNASERDQTAFVSIDALKGATVKGCDSVDTDFEGRPIAVALKVPARGHAECTITIEQVRDEQTFAGNLDIDALTQLAKLTGTPDAIGAVLREGIKILTVKQSMTERKDQLEAKAERVEEFGTRLAVSESSPPGVVARYLRIEEQRTDLKNQAAALEQSAEHQLVLLKQALAKLPHT